MATLKTELILHLGVEGGAADIFRRTYPAGTLRFFLKTFSSGFELSEFEQKSTQQVRTKSKSFLTLEAALEDFAGGSEWVHYFPTKVHAEFRDEVWDLRQTCLSRMEPIDARLMEHRHEQWRLVCGRRGLCQ